MSTHWVDYGFGTPKMVHTVYIMKLLFLYLAAGTAVATLTSASRGSTSDRGGTSRSSTRNSSIWTMMLEMLGLAGSWGPLAGHFKPMTGGVLYWLRPGTIRLPPWPGKVPLTSGDTRTVFDVFIYAAAVANLLVAAVFPVFTPQESIRQSLTMPDWCVRRSCTPSWYSLGSRVAGQGAFIAARSEQYLPAIFFFTFLPFVRHDPGAQTADRHGVDRCRCLEVRSPFLAGGSSDAQQYPVDPVEEDQARHFRNFPEDLRPSHLGGGVAPWPERWSKSSPR